MTENTGSREMAYDEFRRAAVEVTDEIYREGAAIRSLVSRQIIARALLAERDAATKAERERCAKISENNDYWPQEGAEIASAIRGGQ